MKISEDRSLLQTHNLVEVHVRDGITRVHENVLGDRVSQRGAIDNNHLLLSYVVNRPRKGKKRKSKLKQCENKSHKHRFLGRLK